MPKLDANGIDIFYETTGAGEPLVLISGLSYTHWQYHRMVPGLAKKFQVITLDNRGVGQTDNPPGPFSAQMLADDVAGLLEALAIDRAHILGHSMGGFIAQALALSRSDLVDKLILASTNFGGPRAIPPTEEALAILMDVESDPAERFRRGLVISTAPGFSEKNSGFVQEWIDYRAQNPIDPVGYQSQLGIGLALTAEEACFEHKLNDIKSRTLILFGKYDQLVPPGNADLLAAQIPDCEVLILPNAGHHLTLEVPVELNEVINNFISGE